MADTLTDAFRATRYLVCVDLETWADIRIDQPLPRPLLAVVSDHCWGFITAWNPFSQPREEALNVAAQRTLCASLRQLPATIVLLPAVGLGMHGWNEPSLFVVGPAPPALDALARQHQQLAYVHGAGALAACLRFPAT